METSPYAIVDAFVIDAVTDRVIGYAAPAGGDAPCALALYAGETLIAAVRATGFSEPAYAAGVRRGWCGYELPGVRQAAAVSDHLDVRCVVSNKILHSVSVGASNFDTTVPHARTLSAAEITGMAHESETCRSIDELLPFAVAHRQKHGDRSTVEAIYLSLVRRWPDEGAYKNLESGSAHHHTTQLHALLASIVTSDEFARQWIPVIPGPYHPAFRFDRTLLTG